MKNNNIIYPVIIIALILLLMLIVSPLVAMYMVVNDPLNSIQNKVTIGDSNSYLDYPWGNKQKLNIFAGLENVSIDERDYYNYTILLALKWWENDITHNLSYNPNFTLVNNSNDANIIIHWTADMTYNPTDRGYTHINSSGLPSDDPLGIETCDTYNTPFKKCTIEIRTNLSYDENYYVIKHELGHALGFKHIFNRSDFLIRYAGFETNYYLSPSEIMFDNRKYNDAMNSIEDTKRYVQWLIYGLIFIFIVSIVVVAYIKNHNHKTQ